MLRVINLQEKYNKANNEADLEDLYKSWALLSKVYTHLGDEKAS